MRWPWAELLLVEDEFVLGAGHYSGSAQGSYWASDELVIRYQGLSRPENFGHHGPGCLKIVFVGEQVVYVGADEVQRVFDNSAISRGAVEVQDLSLARQSAHAPFSGIHNKFWQPY